MKTMATIFAATLLAVSMAFGSAWDGGFGTANMNSGNYWNPNGVPGSTAWNVWNFNTLATVQWAINNNIAAGQNVAIISFSNDLPANAALQITGVNSMNLQTGYYNFSTRVHTNQFPIALAGASGATISVRDGDLCFRQLLSSGGTSGGNLTLSGGSGTTRTLKLEWTNTFTHKTVISNLTVSAAGGPGGATGCGLGADPASLVNDQLTLTTCVIRTTTAMTLGATRGIVILDKGGVILDPSATLTINGPISGAGQVRNGAATTGEILLFGNNTYKGGTYIDSGTITITNGLGLGATNGIVTMDGGTLRVATNGNATLGHYFSLTGQGVLDVQAGATNRIDGVISSVGGIIKSSGGTLLLATTNIYTGATTNNAGIIGGKGAASSAHTIKSGATISPGIGQGIYQTANLNMQTGSIYAYDLATTTTEYINVIGNLTLPAASRSVTVNVSGVSAPGYYRFFSVTGTVPAFAAVTNALFINPPMSGGDWLICQHHQLDWLARSSSPAVC